MKIITISGLDGSGKSTQIELLKNHLKSQGKSFYYFHAVEFSIGNICRRPTSTSEKSVTKASWLQIQLRKVALMIDICRFNKLLKKKKVDYIISDRYFYDSVVNILYLSKSPLVPLYKRGKSSSLPLLKGELERDLCAEKFIPKPDKVFYIKVSPEKIMQRERKPDQGIEYLLAKEKIFKEKIKDWDMIVVDGEKSKNEIFDEIKSKINV